MLFRSLPADLGIQAVEHFGRIVPRETDVVFHERVQRLHADVVAGAGLESAPMILAAAVGVLQVGAAHGEHGAAAVAALEEACVDVVVLLCAAVVHRAAAGAQLAHGGEGAVVDDRLVMVFDHDVLARVAGHVLAVDLLAGVFALAQRADIKVVVQNALNRLDRPRGLDLALGVLALGLAAELLGHARRRDALLCEVVRDLLVAPAVEVAREDLPDNVRLGRHDLKLLLRRDNIAVRRGADPLAVLLLAVHDGADFLRGVRHRHFVEEKLELDLQPVIVVRKVDSVADGDDAHAVVAQILQLHQPAAVTAGEAGEVLNHENVELVGDQALAHLLIPLALLEGVAAPVAVFKHRERAPRKPLRDKLLNDRLLVLNRSVVPVLLLVHGDAAVPGNVESFYQCISPSFRSCFIVIVLYCIANYKSLIGTIFLSFLFIISLQNKVSVILDTLYGIIILTKTEKVVES